MAQTFEYIRPLLKQLKTRTAHSSMVPLLGEIVCFIQQREYSQANDAYLRLSIGKAAWPIGVTNVGIHSRGGREKIAASNIAHILNDDTSRKYIQAVKRLMTYAQTRFPVAPSKSFEMNAVAGSKLYPIAGAQTE